MTMRLKENDFGEADESGFTLIELLISSGLSLIVLVIAGGIMIAGLRTQETARTVTDAANTAQQIVHSVQAGVKNASAITVTSNATTGTQLLLVRTLSSDPNSTAASCQAWYYTPSNGGGVYTTKTTPASTITLPTGGPQGIWTILGTGISPADPTTGKVFNAPNGGRVELKFDVAAGAHPYVLINTMTYNSQSTSASAPCF
jgi:type II secretory pathway pseudopilin PulG